MTYEALYSKRLATNSILPGAHTVERAMGTLLPRFTARKLSSITVLNPRARDSS